MKKTVFIRIRIIFYWFFLTASIPAYTLSFPLPQEDNFPFFLPAEHIDFYVDTSFSESIHSIVESPERFQPVQHDVISMSGHKGVLWLRIAIDNPDNYERNLIVDTGVTRIAPAAIYQVSYDKNTISEVVTLVDINKSGDISNLPFFYPYLSSAVTIAADSQSVFYIAMGTDFGFTTRIELTTLTRLATSYQVFMALLWLVVGFLGCFSLLNLYVYTVFAQRKYLYYAMQELSLIVLALHLAGPLYVLGWPGDLLWDTQVTLITPAVIALFCALFAQHSLETRTSMPLIHRGFNVCIGITMLGAVLICIFPNKPINAVLFTSIGWFCLAVFLCLAGLMGVKRSIPTAVPLAIGWASFVAAELFYTAGVLFATYDYSLNISVMILGFLVEGLFLAAALSRRIDLIKKSREQFRDELQIATVERLYDAKNISLLAQEKLLADEKFQNKVLAIASTSHDIFQPLYTIRASLEGIKDELSNKSVLDKINQSIQYVENILKTTVKQSYQEVSAQDQEVSRTESGCAAAQLPQPMQR